MSIETIYDFKGVGREGNKYLGIIHEVESSGGALLVVLHTHCELHAVVLESLKYYAILY